MNQARFSVNCPDCGDVELGADQLWLVLPTAGDAHYDFHCPECGQLVRHVAGPSAIAFLAPLVAVEEIDVPAEALEPRSGAPLTMDDVLDFANELAGESWAAELLGDDAPAAA
jgi:predicted RNA-binding Zn-ribbon protein involved in translation (DUF1610 family)